MKNYFFVKIVFFLSVVFFLGLVNKAVMFFWPPILFFCCFLLLKEKAKQNKINDFDYIIIVSQCISFGIWIVACIVRFVMVPMMLH